jgi:hypothetical protein
MFATAPGWMSAATQAAITMSFFAIRIVLFHPPNLGNIELNPS